MSLTTAALNRPISTYMVYLALTLLGLVSLKRLPVDMLPEVEFPTVAVMVKYPNAGPQEVETTVVAPLERALATISNVDRVDSSCAEETARIRVRFAWGTNMDAAALDVQQQVARAKPLLPDEIDEPVVFKFDPAQWPILHMGFSGDMDPVALRQYAEDVLQDRLSQVEGVAAVNVLGGAERQVRVEVNRARAAALGVTLQQIVARVRGENLNLTEGVIETGRREYLVRTVGEFRKVQQVQDVVLMQRNGAPIRLKHVAEVVDGVKDSRNEMRLMRGPGVVITVQKRPGTNTVQVADRVMARVAALRKTTPPGTDFQVIFDQSVDIRAAIRAVVNAVAIGAVLSTGIMFFFLRHVGPTLVIGTAIPIGMLVTFMMMDGGRMTLNLMSLGGLAVAMADLIDNNILVLENIFRHRAMGKSMDQASRDGSAEVSLAVTATTLSHMAVYLPLLYISGMIGVMFRQLALTVTFAILASRFGALTLVPVLARQWLGEYDERAEESTRFARWAKGAWERVVDRYDRTLDWTLAHRVRILGATVGLVALALVSFFYMPKTFMPSTDEGQLSLTVELPVGTRFEATREAALRIEHVLKTQVPEIRAMYCQIGQGTGWLGRGTEGSHTAAFRVRLVPAKARKRSTQAIISALREELSFTPNARLYFTDEASLMTRLLGGGEARIQAELRGYDLEEGGRIARDIARIMGTVPGVRDARVGREERKPELQVKVLRERAAAMGLDLTGVTNAVRSALSGDVATRFRERGKEYEVLVQYREADRSDPDALPLTAVGAVGKFVGADLQVGPSSRPILLRAVADIREDVGPVRIVRRDQERLVQINGRFEGKDMAGAVREIEKRVAQDIRLPSGFSLKFGGEEEQRRKSFREMRLAVGLSVLLIFMVLASQFENLVSPLIVMAAVPLAAIGIAGVLFLTGTPLSVPAFIGIITVVGIAVNNSVMQVDFMNQYRRAGMSLRDAVREARRNRLRPEMMTTLTSFLGVLPLALALGAESETNVPMGRAIVGGSLVSALLTFFVVPVLYTLVAEWQSRRGLKTGR